MTFRLRISLRVLLVLVVLLGLLLAPVANRMNDAKQRKAAVDRILRVGGQVFYEYDIDENGKWPTSARPATPPWLRNLVGEDFFYFHRVRAAICYHSSPASRLLNDSDLEGLKHLKELRILFCNANRITDAGLENLQGLATLEYLVLREGHITDGGLERIKGLTNLENLTLDGTEVTDAGIEHLVHLKKLSSLSLRRTGVTRDGVIKLRKALPNCIIVR